MKRDAKLFVEDVLDSINAIEEFSKNMDKKELISNRLKQSAIVREIEIIGEAVKNLPDYFKEKYPHIPWSKITGMRDIITHGYFKVDLEIIWEAIKDDIPRLKKQIQTIKEELANENLKDKNN